MRYLVLVLVTALSSALPAFADAQEMKSVEIDYSAKPPVDCSKIRVAGLSTAVAISAFGIPMGAALILGGADTSSPATSASPGLIATGAALAALSVGGLVASSIFLKRKVEKKRIARRKCVARRDTLRLIRF